MKRNLLLIVNLLLLADCSSGKEYTVDGASDHFCVPKKNLIPDIWWIPPDKPGTPRGFSFQGCWNADPSLKQTCDIPFLRGADVSPLSAFRGQRWQDFKGAFYRTIVTEPGTKLEAADNGNVMIVSNALMSPQWYVWKKAAPLPPGAKPFLSDGDTVIAACNDETANIPYKGGTRRYVSCIRSFAGKELAVTYYFETQRSERVPTNTDQMDAAILSQLDKWRCPR
jgi:hypothetical protein